jgi:hypothetical protein
MGDFGFLTLYSPLPTPYSLDFGWAILDFREIEPTKKPPMAFA